MLRAVHDGGGTQTRAQLTRQLSLARGTATVLVRELAGRRLITELAGPAGPAAQRSRGRPTGVPSAHPDGPVALAVDLRDDSYTVAAFELTGRGRSLGQRPRSSPTGAGMLAEVAAALTEHRAGFGDRVVGIGIAVPSPVSDGRMVEPTLPDWRGIDVAAALGPDFKTVLIGNDATLAGLAEARRGALHGLSVALHLHVATGIGGVLLAGGRAIIGVSGAAGEFGHMPLTGGTLQCRCGAIGCWELDAGTRGLLRRAGRSFADPGSAASDPSSGDSSAGSPSSPGSPSLSGDPSSPGGDRMEEAARIIAAAADDPVAAAALGDVADALGRGVGALVNAHDPEAIGLSGLAARVYQAAPAAVWSGYQATLMRFHRAAPPPLIPSRLGDLGTLTGAAELVFDEFLTPRGLSVWRLAVENSDDVAANPW
jgi:predicted NBD/HSP70 family sugar kinase